MEKTTVDKLKKRQYKNIVILIFSILIMGFVSGRVVYYLLDTVFMWELVTRIVIIALTMLLVCSIIIAWRITKSLFRRILVTITIHLFSSFVMFIIILVENFRAWNRYYALFQNHIL